MEDDNRIRIQDEYNLLEAMYPEEVAYNPKSREMHYSHAGASLLLRLSDLYPQQEAPQIISATGSAKTDLRDKLKGATTSLPVGEEALDSIINVFRQLLAEDDLAHAGEDALNPKPSATSSQSEIRKQTTIIWLHHLLNTNKRKLALSPVNGAISGISKPGYPGVLVFSGAASGVQEHINVLKHQNWAAFQIRYEAECEWAFQHGAGIKEFETMGEVVKDVGDRKDEFLEAMRIR